MLAMLLAYDAAGNVVATLDYVVAHDGDGNVVGLIDFAAHEEAGGEHTDIWVNSEAVGSKVWPEWIGARAHDFRVELEGPPGAKRIATLIHKTSGYRRERAVLEAEIDRRIAANQAAVDAAMIGVRARDPDGKLLPGQPLNHVGPGPVDIRDLVGGPDRPLLLDDEGRTAVRDVFVRPNLPIIGVAAPAVESKKDGTTGP
jgi:hypothetical protein